MHSLISFLPFFAGIFAVAFTVAFALLTDSNTAKIVETQVQRIYPDISQFRLDNPQDVKRSLDAGLPGAW